MCEPFIGEIQAFAANYVPEGWFLCDGSLKPVASYTALFSILGTRFGGDGRQTFGVPNLQDAAVIGKGQAPTGITKFPFGSAVGENTATIAAWPGHYHVQQRRDPAKAGVASKVGTPTAATDPALLGTHVENQNYNMMLANGLQNTTLSPNSLDAVGAATAGPHENRQPFLAMYYAIAYDGVYPVRAG
jgi:microcystin-dependent protein